MRYGLRAWLFGGCLACSGLATATVQAADAPDWMHALVGAPVPAHDDKADAVEMYSESQLSVQPNGRMTLLTRDAYLILRPDGERWGRVRRDFDAQSPITSMRAWCIPATGKDYALKDRDAAEVALPGVENGDLVTDVRSKMMQIPAATPGNIVGVEIEQQLQPYLLDDEWQPQDEIPVREARYTLRLPAGWDYRAVWFNHAPIAPVATGSGSWSWVASDMPRIRVEKDMPPWRGIAAHMVVSLIPPAGKLHPLLTWQDVGRWDLELARDRDVATPDIHQKVQELTAGKSSKFEQVQALASFVQREVRYVAIELGIGGYQPHPATEVFQHRYGDCKDKATLLHAMLGDIGVESYYIDINTVRGNVTIDSPPHLGFNHMILAIGLPTGVTAPELLAWYPHPKLGKLLVFDPTDEFTPLGRLSGSLQANTALLVTPEGGELVVLPQLRSDSSAVNRTATLTLNAEGELSGDVREVRIGDPAAFDRYELRNAAGNDDRIKPIEARLADSLSDFTILKASVGNLAVIDQPFEWHYTLDAQRYAKFAGDLMLVRPRVLGTKSSGLLETREPRENPIEFDGPRFDTDSFEIALPAGFEVDDLPPPVDVDVGYAAYHSKTQAVGRTLRYTRTFEIKQLSVPLAKAGELKEFYRTIWNDERRTAVLRPIAH